MTRGARGCARARCGRPTTAVSPPQPSSARPRGGAVLTRRGLNSTMDDSDKEDDSMKTRKLGLEENVIINQDSQNKHTTFNQED